MFSFFQKEKQETKKETKKEKISKINEPTKKIKPETLMILLST